MKQIEYVLKRYGEAAFLLFLTLSSGIMFADAFTIRSLSSGTDKLGPALMPKLIFGFMLILSLFILLDYFKIRRPVLLSALQKAVSPAEKAKENNQNKRGLIAVGGIFLFLILLKTVGFLLASVCYLALEFFALSSNLNTKKKAALLILAIVFSGLVYYLFRYEVNVKLPVGILG